MNIGYSSNMQRRRRTNYLNNRDLLLEIHKSKKTYCKYRKPQDSDFDIITDDVKKINQTRIQEARKAKIDKIKKETGEIVLPKDIADTDLVFRVMTWEHIPMVAKKPTKSQQKKKAKLDEMFAELDTEDYSQLDESYPETKMVYEKCNFPPFFHYRVDDQGQPFVVGKSHWSGSLNKGKFSKDHGKMTDKLAMMFMKLCERYATRSNWRGYTYNEEMRGQALLQLSQIGLQFDESKSSNPFAYYTAAITNSFTRILNIEKRNQNIRDDILEMNGLNPSWTRQNKEKDAKLLEKNRFQPNKR